MVILALIIYVVWDVIDGIKESDWYNSYLDKKLDKELAILESYDKQEVTDFEQLTEVTKKLRKPRKYTLQQAIDQIELVTQSDDFEGTTRIYFNHVANKDSDHLPMYFDNSLGYATYENIGLSFEIFQNKFYLDVSSNVTDMNLAKGDRLILVFDNKEKIEIVFTSTHLKGYYDTNSYLLNTQQIKLFIDHRLDKWKLISTRRKIYIAGDNSFFEEECLVHDKKVFQGILNYLAKMMMGEYIRINKEAVTA